MNFSPCAVHQQVTILSEYGCNLAFKLKVGKHGISFAGRLCLDNRCLTIEDKDGHNIQPGTTPNKVCADRNSASDRDPFVQSSTVLTSARLASISRPTSEHRIELPSQ
ncbi:hypothetical protein PTSG_03796 [Salpingoeca rosetta]|uniref:Uncharacterized protein n=1 Tax=Salpingoeca rosetta (strain ATCC 50818 / BSB-021) TaxID=946362 RepID=F2U5E9_SALR5|nr:uncharacterized protein PTSG_03796 [Salpingoeca rosetta]EGD83165.1 hypothetical protein PTSG_03796 [Salpingoeca rosetta]|eukprot:XP_004995529.1 hypothetical protein PTSG_03796 [Salpingoeca rosetta]